MKKLSIFICLFFCFSIYLNAECTYKDQRQLITLAGYVTTDYVFDDNSGLFSLTFENLTDRMKVVYIEEYESVDGLSTINNLHQGENVKVEIRVKDDDECSNYTLRNVNINLPYLNKYYGREECEKKQELKVCNSKFLDYQLSEEQFENLINQVEEEKIVFPDNIIIEEAEKLTFFESIVRFIKKIYIPVGLVILSGGITFLIFNLLYRRIKHGL